MSCRSLPIAEIERVIANQCDLSTLKMKSKKIFRGYSLKWPDFIEFDELNAKIVTRHTEDRLFRVWSLETYHLLYVMSHPQLSEFKIW